MNNIVPMRDLSTKTSQIVQMCEETGQPVFVTKNGYGSVVVMSMESFARDFAMLDMQRKVNAAMAQIERGEVVTLEEMKKEFGSNGTI